MDKSTPDRDDIIRKVGALLDLASEPGPEGVAALNKAHDLMQKHGITSAEARRAAEPEPQPSNIFDAIFTSPDRNHRGCWRHDDAAERGCWSCIERRWYVPSEDERLTRRHREKRVKAKAKELLAPDIAAYKAEVTRLRREATKLEKAYDAALEQVNADAELAVWDEMHAENEANGKPEECHAVHGRGVRCTRLARTTYEGHPVCNKHAKPPKYDWDKFWFDEEGAA